MKARHILYLVVVAGAIALALNSCQLLGIVSISDRISDFQSSLNNSDRSQGYQNFLTTASDYDAVKSTTFGLWATTFPTGNSPYSLSITDQSNSSAVAVTVTGSNSFPTLYLQIGFQSTGIGNNLISTVATSSAPGGPFTTIFQ